jgi:hypothetical protein
MTNKSTISTDMITKDPFESFCHRQSGQADDKWVACSFCTEPALTEDAERVHLAKSTGVAVRKKRQPGRLPEQPSKRLLKP